MTIFFLRLCYVILLCHSTLENTIILFKKRRKKKDPFFVWFLFWYLNYFRQRVSMYAKTHAHKPIILACHVKRKVHSDIVSMRNFPFQYILQIAKIEIKQVKFRLVLRTYWFVRKPFELIFVGKANKHETFAKKEQPLRFSILRWFIL